MAGKINIAKSGNDEGLRPFFRGPVSKRQSAEDTQGCSGRLVLCCAIAISLAAQIILQFFCDIKCWISAPSVGNQESKLMLLFSDVAHPAICPLS